jgi:hypothetical protein
MLHCKARTLSAIKLSRHTGMDAGIHRPWKAQVGCNNAC